MLWRQPERPLCIRMIGESAAERKCRLSFDFIQPDYGPGGAPGTGTAPVLH
jgi:hypothetical protein